MCKWQTQEWGNLKDLLKNYKEWKHKFKSYLSSLRNSYSLHKNIPRKTSLWPWKSFITGQIFSLWYSFCNFFMWTNFRNIVTKRGEHFNFTRLFFVGRFLITDSISMLVICLSDFLFLRDLVLVCCIFF